MQVGYLGPKSSFTHTATTHAFKKEAFIPYSSIPLCIKAVQQDEVTFSVVPIENTIEGSVHATIDHLFHHVQVPIQAEVELQISQQLLVSKEHTNNWQKMEKILSHPQALAQSANFIDTYFPTAQIEATNSTAFAAQIVAENNHKRFAAIAPKEAATAFGLSIVQENIQDLMVNRTRFLVLGKQELSLPLKEKTRKMTIALTLPNNLPGALHKVLSAFSWREIDLSKIESRPLKTKLGEYFFLIDLNSQKNEQLIQNALEEIRLMGAEILILGEYPSYEI